MAIDGYTKSLLHFNGANGSTIFTDESGKIWTAYGNARISTTEFKFGGASSHFDGEVYASYMLCQNSSDFNMYASLMDWTVDYWFYTADISGGVRTHFDFYNGYLTNLGLHIYHNGTTLHVDNGNTASGLAYGLLSSNTWYHHAVVNSGGTILCFVNGTLADSEGAQNYGNSGTDSRLQLGAFSTMFSYNYNGYLDEIRVSKGIARWTSNFTPPTRQYGAMSGSVCNLSQGFGAM